MKFIAREYDLHVCRSSRDSAFVLMAARCRWLQSVYVVQVYADSQRAPRAEDSMALMMAAVAWVRSFCGVRAFFVEDFNLSLDGIISRS